MHKFTRQKFYSIFLLSKIYCIRNSCPGNFNGGFIVPGHRLQGKLEWLCEDSDLIHPYSLYSGRKDIVLWFFLRVEKWRFRKMEQH